MSFSFSERQTKENVTEKHNELQNLDVILFFAALSTRRLNLPPAIHQNELSLLRPKELRALRMSGVKLPQECTFSRRAQK